LTDRRTFLVRACRASDIDALIDLFSASVRTVALRDYTHAQVVAWAPDAIDREAWAARCGSRQVWLAEIDRVVAGFGDLEADGHLDMMYVHPAYLGQGVAGGLLRHIDAAARAHALARLYTEASMTARPFFERSGFRLIAPQTVSVRGQEFLRYRMEKSLR
jgi:putative acetyltransferase